MKLTSKVEHEFTIKLNLEEAKDLQDILARNGGYTGKMCYLYDALLIEFHNLNLPYSS
jgi:hypothetical protein